MSEKKPGDREDGGRVRRDLVTAVITAAASAAVTVAVTTGVSVLGNLLVPLMVVLAPCHNDQQPVDPGLRVDGCQAVLT
ncbi:hypothetical protein [Nocardia sp. NBC_01329]|uniref:hypothetical protein n=1 Tax=Nocardia sp. NBC_01329 TaxID=2903594 RepID=UPI002E128C3E|nr:hypothetical protein OG405_15240 [Nocardia sp. NBC_01329]